MKRIFPVIIATILCLHSDAQQYVYKHFTKENGLAGNTAYCISQDNDGFIWIGTENGASRFDGHSFTNFTVNDGLTDNEVLEIFSDKQGRTWFVCFTGSLCYYYKGKIYNYRNDKKLTRDFIPSQIVYRGCVEDSYGNVFVIAKKIFIYKNDEYKKQLPDTSFLKLSMHHLNNTSDSATQFITLKISEHSADIYTLKDGTFKFKELAAPDFFLSGPQVAIKYAASGGDRLIIYYGDSIFSCKISNRKIDILKKMKASDPINRILCDTVNNKIILCSYNNGVIIMNSGLEPLEHILSNENISTVLTDKDKNQWFTTLGNGIFFLSRTRVRYFTLTDGLALNNIDYLGTQKKNKLILGFRDGIVQQLENRKFSAPKQISNKKYEANIVRGYFQTPAGNYFYCTDREIVETNPNSEVIGSYDDIGALKGFAILNDNKILFGNNSGIYLRDSAKGLDTLLKKRVTFVSSIADANSNYWIAGTDSLYYLNRNKLAASELYSIHDNGRIADIVVNDNALWIATYNNGLAYICQNRLFLIKEGNGLASNQCRKLYSENDTVLWVATSNGISKVVFDQDCQVKSIKNMSAYDGLSSETITGLAKIKDTLWISTWNGLNFFKENQLSFSPDHSVFITGFFFNDSSLTITDNLLHLQNGKIKIKFNGISFSSGGRLKYKYRINGLDKNFTSTTLDEIELSSLKPGKYLFEVYAVDENNIQSKKSANISFEILPHWWQTDWFKLLLATCLSVIMWIAFKSRIKKIRKTELEKTAINKKFAELKLEAVRSQMDPHFIFNCLNAIQHFNIREDYKSAQHFMAEFAGLIRKTLNHSHRDFIVLADEAELLETYIKLEKLRFEDMFDYSITMSESVKFQSADLLVPSLIFQPYVENAINHGLRFLKGGRGILQIQFTIVDNRLITVIEDNGIGINASRKIKSEKSSEKESFGINLTDSRIEVINKIHDWDITQTINDKSLNDVQTTGTLVEVSLPLKLK